MTYRTLLIAIVLTACGANAEDATTDLSPGSAGSATESEPKSDDVIPTTTPTATASYASVLSAIAGAPNAGTVSIGVAGLGVAGASAIPVVAAGSSSVAVVAIVSGLGGASSVATTVSPNRPFATGGSAATSTPTTKVVVAGLGGSASTSTLNLTPPVSPDADVVCCLFDPLSTGCYCFGGKEADCVARVKSGSTRCAAAP
jgi:hypothetical protein